MDQDRPAEFVLRTDEGQDWPEIRRRLEVGCLDEEIGEPEFFRVGQGLVEQCDNRANSLAAEKRRDGPEPVAQIGMRCAGNLAMHEPLEP